MIRVKGENPETGPFVRSWHMSAEGDDGPMVPSMPAAIIIARLLDDEPPKAGARPALRELELPAYDPIFNARRIRYGFRDEITDRQGPLYPRVLASAYGSLPPSLQAMHDRAADKTVRGVAQIDRGTGLLARIGAALVGFPPAGRDVPVTVSFALREGAEIWLRDFDGQRFHSVQTDRNGRSDGLIEERFGPATFALAYEITGGRGHIVLRKWQFLGIPMPMWLAPRSRACEYEEDGKFHFLVEISHALTGLIVRYRGWLA